MQTNPSPPDRKKGLGLRQMRDLVMGILYLFVSVFAVYAEKNQLISFGLGFVYFMSAVFAIYGIFRIYRAFRK